MQEKESVMAVRFELKIPSPGIIVRLHSAAVTLTTEFSIRTSQPLKIHIVFLSSFKKVLNEQEDNNCECDGRKTGLTVMPQRSHKTQFARRKQLIYFPN